MTNQEIKKAFEFELRNEQGNEIGTDAAGEMTYAEAVVYAQKWLAEVVDFNLGGTHILIVDPDNDETVFQGDFGYCGYFAEDPIIKTPRVIQAEEDAKFAAQWAARRG